MNTYIECQIFCQDYTPVQTVLKDRSLITRRGRYKQYRASPISSLQKGEGGKERALAMLKGRGTQCFWVFLTQVLEVLAILNGSTENVHPFCSPTSSI